jgi:phenylacetate-CoA ligase
MVQSKLFILAHQAGNRHFHSTYRYLAKNQWRPYPELREQQDGRLECLVRYAYDQVPYYRRLFDQLGLRPRDVRRVEDLEKLPILTKETIRQNWEDFKPAQLASLRYQVRHTGGSTGTPFTYRISSYNRFCAAAVLYSGWGYAGYELGDRMIFYAGSALDVGTSSWMRTRVHETVRNIRKISSVDTSDTAMERFAATFNRFKPQFFRGYPNPIYFFAKYLVDHDIEIHSPVAIFTTAEKLYPHQREAIMDAFGCDVFDHYGLNDGSVEAFECPEHAGLHINTERGVMEVVDDRGEPRECGEGRILATSLHNEAMPFIRYDTGDIGHLIEDECACGRGYRMLKSVMGRKVDVLLTPEGRTVFPGFFVRLLDECEGIAGYQVIQERPDTIQIRIAPAGDFDANHLDAVRSTVHDQVPAWNLEIAYVESIEKTGAGKNRYVVNRLLRDR